MALFGLGKSKEQKLAEEITRSGNLLKEISSTRVQDLQTSVLDGWNPDAFMSRKGFRTIDRMLVDEAIYSILEFKKLFILSTGYAITIDPEGNEDLKEFVEDNFNSKYNGLLTYDLYQTLTKFEYGFSVSEKVFEKVDNNLYLTRIKTVPPHSIDFVTDTFGKLEKIYQRQEIESDVELPLEKMLINTNAKRFDNPYGISDMKRCYRSWFSKDLVIKLWNIYLQRFASPFPVGKVSGEFGTTKVNELISILDSIQQKVSLVIPKEADLELLKVGNSSGEYDMAIERYNQMIARALLIPDLVGFGQTIKGGSYSLGEKHFDAFLRICEFEQIQLQELVSDNAIKQLIDINFGKQEHYPKFKFLPFSDERLKEYAEIFISAVERGKMPVGEEDWNHMRSIFGYPDIPEDAKVVEDSPEPTDHHKPEENDSDVNNPDNQEDEPDLDKDDRGIPDGTGPHGIGKGAGKGKADGTGLKKEPNKKGGAKDDDSSKAFADIDEDIKLSREPNMFEERTNFIEQNTIIDEIERKTVLRVAEKFKLIEENLLATIKKKQIIEKVLFDEVPKLRLKYLGDVRSIFDFDFNDIYETSAKMAVKEIKQLEKEQKFTDMLYSPQLKNKEMVAKAKELITAQSFQATGKLSDDLLNKIKQILLTGMEEGKSEAKIAMELKQAFNGVIIGTTTAALTPSPALLKTIVRTNRTNFFNLARRQVGAQSDFVNRYQYSAILDSRTTDICMSLDQNIYDKNDAFWATMIPPNHFNCRSQINYITAVDIAKGDGQLSQSASGAQMDSLEQQSGGFVKFKLGYSIDA